MEGIAVVSRFVFIPLWIVFCIVAVGFAGNVLYAGERLAVKVEAANIRSGPGTGYAVLWQVGRYHPLNVIQKKGDWYKLRDFEGDTGWISKGLVGKMEKYATSYRQAVAMRKGYRGLAPISKIKQEQLIRTFQNEPGRIYK